MRLCRQPPFHLPASLLLSAASEVLGIDLPGEIVLEGEGAPGLAWTNILSPYPQQDQIGQQHHRVQSKGVGSYSLSRQGLAQGFFCVRLPLSVLSATKYSTPSEGAETRSRSAPPTRPALQSTANSRGQQPA